MIKSRNPLQVEVTRGPLIESTHDIVVAIASKKKIILGYAGNLDYTLTPRSSIKPLQAFPLLESGAFEAFKLNEKHLVLACASHKAEKHHLESLKEWLGLIQKTDAILRCGPGPNSNTPLTHNCSGKHLGMISTAMHLKLDPTKYDHFEHPYQDFLRKYLSEITQIDFMKAPHGIDGCCIPTYGMSIQKLALAMTLLVNDEPSEIRRRHCTRIIDAIRKYPEYLSGENDFSSKLIEVSQGRAILKTGAEGAYTGLMPEQGIAFAMKVIDGNQRAAEVAALHIFKVYGALATPEFEKLKEYAEAPILNSRNEKVGVIRLKPM